MEKLLFTDRVMVKGRALFLGERLDLKALEKTGYLATLPLVVGAGDRGCAVLFRYGAIVLFGLDPVEEASFLSYLQPLVIEPFTTPETEEAILMQDNVGGRVENGTIWLQEFDVRRIQIVADVLSKSVVLAHYEGGTAKVFDQLEPFADSLQRSTKDEHWGKELLRQLGRTLTIQHKIVGRVEIIDKPELLWDSSPDLERLYARLENEYEIRERHLALERKLDLISRTAETVLNLLQHNTGLRVEWYVVILIVVEIVLSLFDLFLEIR
jgi:uncharacterized Rmd1/YagE family protein